MGEARTLNFERSLMAVASAQVAVSTTAVALNTATTGGQRLYLINGTGAAVFLGASAVTSSTGAALPASTSLLVELDAGDALYAICAAATSTTLSVLAL
jgi:hypothetical protein